MRASSLHLLWASDSELLSLDVALIQKAGFVKVLVRLVIEGLVRMHHGLYLVCQVNFHLLFSSSRFIKLRNLPLVVLTRCFGTV